MCYTLYTAVIPDSDLTLHSSDTTSRSSIVEDYVAVVRGGNSETVSRLASKHFPTPDIMQLWGEAVHYSPDFISTKVIKTLIPAVLKKGSYSLTLTEGTSVFKNMSVNHV